MLQQNCYVFLFAKLFVIISSHREDIPLIEKPGYDRGRQYTVSKGSVEGKCLYDLLLSYEIFRMAQRECNMSYKTN